VFRASRDLEESGSRQSKVDAGRRSTRNVSGLSAFDTCGLSRRINRDKSPVRARAGTCRRASTAISGSSYRMSSRPLSFSLGLVAPFVPKILPVYYRLHQHVVPRRGSCRQTFTSLLLVLSVARSSYGGSRTYLLRHSRVKFRRIRWNFPNSSTWSVLLARVR